jgi:hypothetical protein
LTWDPVVNPCPFLPAAFLNFNYSYLVNEEC